MKNTVLFLLAILPTVLMTSCLGNDEINSTAQYNQRMVHIKNSNGEVSLHNATYRFDIDYTDGLIDITVYDESIYAAAFSILDIPLTYSNELGYTFRTTAATPVDGNGAAISDLTITDLYGGNTLAMRYTVNSTTTIVSIPSATTYGFTDISTVGSDGTTYNYDESSVSMSYRITTDSALVDMTLTNIKFVDNMPVIQTMTFPSIEVAPSSSGTSLQLSADEIIPQISNTPYPDYKITNFSGRVDPSFNAFEYFINENMTSSFNCMNMNVQLDARMFSSNNDNSSN